MKDRQYPLDSPFGELAGAGLSPPVTLTLSITGACNLQCRHCWVDAGAAEASGHVPLSRILRKIEEFAELGGEGLRLTGGEPLCHPGWAKALRRGRELGFRHLFLQSNGMLFGNEQVAVLRELSFPGLSIQVSLDGATAANHEAVRGEGTFPEVMAGLHRLVAAGLGPALTLFFTEMRHNLHEIPQLLELADRLQVGAVVTASLVRCGRASVDAVLAPAEPRQYLELLELYRGDPRFRSLYGRLGTVAAIEWQIHPEHSSSCCNFIENPYLSPAGNFYPCILCHADDFAVAQGWSKPLDSILREGIPLWSALSALSRRRKEELGACRDCPEKPVCAGGCLGRALGSCGDPMAVDDRCELRRTLGRQGRSEGGKS